MSDLHMCVTCGKVGGPCRWIDDAELCMRQQLLQLRPVIDAAREMREATQKYERVTANLPISAHEFSTQWHEASREQLQAERDLDLALEALKQVPQ